jgi:hypothetical protein
MSKILLRQGYVEIQVSWLERALLGEKPQKLPLDQIRAVDAHPRLPDMMLHWLARQELWMSGVSAYEGQLIPTTRNPARTLAIDLGDDEGRIFVELDDETPETAAARINTARDAEDEASADAHQAGPRGEPSTESFAAGLMALGGITVTAGVTFAIAETAPNPLFLGAGVACAVAGVIARSVTPSK